jgi:hypothetical protein
LRQRNECGHVVGRCVPRVLRGRIRGIPWKIWVPR